MALYTIRENFLVDIDKNLFMTDQQFEDFYLVFHAKNIIVFIFWISKHKLLVQFCQSSLSTLFYGKGV